MRVQPQMAPHHDTESQLHMVSSVSNETFLGKEKDEKTWRTRERGSKGVVVSLRTLKSDFSGRGRIHGAGCL